MKSLCWNNTSGNHTSGNHMIGNQTSGKQNTLLETNPCYCKPVQTSLVESSDNSGNNASGNHIIGNTKTGYTLFFKLQDSFQVFFAANYAPKFLFQFASLCWRSNIIPFCILQIASFCHGKLILWNARFGMKMVGFEFKNLKIKVLVEHTMHCKCLHRDLWGTHRFSLQYLWVELNESRKWLKEGSRNENLFMM